MKRKGWFLPLNTWSVDIASEEVGEALRKAKSESKGDDAFTDFYSQPLNEVFAHIHGYAADGKQPEEKQVDSD